MTLRDLADLVVPFALHVAMAALALAFLLVIWRIWKGPTLADRVLGLDLITSTTVCFIGVIAIDTGFTIYVDVAIGLGLVGFLATVAFARFILVQEKKDEAASHRLEAGDKAADEGSA
ncbi:cation:proton antiporter [Consotaella salsifontis]|uniref:Multicomponent Na+:H+ antiporter subunit F n=1 Tax=Consotaella salsifontis TaxID=1365950 RepID=A0A1T4NNZ2_9HYPH|nr:cation:proton antiporter [Consotaella salsifontis]SJZ81040.1 multicomponent Na+:H+ antiporter subunit F [Consotaella salsifontis]